MTVMKDIILLISIPNVYLVNKDVQDVRTLTLVLKVLIVIVYLMI